MNSNSKENYFQSVKPTRLSQIHFLTGLLLINSAVLKHFKMLLLLCAILCSGVILAPTVYGQEVNELNIVPTTSDPVQETTKRLLSGKSGIDFLMPNTKLTIEEVRAVTQLSPGVANAVRNLPGCTTNTLPRNDDESTGPISLPFNINFFGENFSQTYVNNNGNITFTGPLRTFTPFPLTGTNIPIIAPFFADVDTRNTASGVVQFGNTTVDDRQAFCVNYVNVGYFSQKVDKLNTFQVILIDRTNTGPGNFDIEFNYNQIQWETGNNNGLGGNSARAGYANGNATPGTFFELPGSGVNGGLLDTNSTTGLTNNSRNSEVIGRYVFESRNGTIIPCTYSFNPTDANFGFEGGNGSFAVTNTEGTDCSWTAQSDVPWLTTSSSGTGNGTVNYTVAANTTLSPRTGTITVGGQTFTVTQQALTCNYSLNPTNSNVPAFGGQFTFNVTTNSSLCPVSASSNVPWLATSISNNGGVTTIIYSVESNPDMSPRTGTITVGDQTFTVTQAAAGCMYSISPTSASVIAGGGIGSFAITTMPGCSWSAVSNVNWLTTSSSGTGSGTVNYTVAANNTLSPRTGTITVGGQIFTVTQAAAVCIYSVSPTSQIVEAAAGTYSFTVFASPGCSWTATPLDSWITTTASGTGNGTASYTVSANMGAARQGRIRVNDQIFTVNQRSPVITAFSISGRVTNGVNGPGLSGVRVTLSGPDSREAITDSDGNYLFNNLAPANYTVTPLLTGAIINPTVSTIPFLDRDRTADFTLAVCSYSVSPSDRNVSEVGSSGSFIVNGCGSIPWQAESNVSWIIVDNEGRGAGTQAVGYFVQRNYGAARSGVIAVNGQLHTIIQDAFTPLANRNDSPQVNTPQCVFQLANPVTNLRRQVVPFTGISSGSFEVNAASQGNVANCRWKAVTGSPWIKIANNGDGAGDQAVSFTVEENQMLRPRFGTISVDNEVFTVVQTSNQSGCNYNLNPPRRNYPEVAGSGSEYSFRVETAPDCRWRTFIDEMDTFTTNWLKIDGGTNRITPGPGSRSFTIGANEGTKTNEGTIVVGDKAFTIVQDAGKAEDCKFAFADPGESVLATGGTNRRVNVLTAAGCNWTAVSNVSWIRITGGTGQGNGTVSFNIDPNTETIVRPGLISIMQTPSVQYTITQAAPETCSYTIDPGFQRAENIGTTGTIRVTASNACGSQTLPVVNNNRDQITITSGDTVSANGMVNFVVRANLETVPRVLTIKIADQTFTINQDAGNITSSIRTGYDFDGDGRADISVFRPSNGVWYLNQSISGFTGVQFGQDGDKLVAADYDGDGRTDVAVYRAGTWYLNRSILGFTGVAFGESTDIPVPGDYDGDGKADLAVWRPSNGVWYVYNLVNNQVTFAQFGAPTDQPVVGDFNGDGKSDFAVFRPSNGFWYIARPTGTPSQNFDSIQLGTTGDKPVPADYDGDGKTDVAVFRPSNGTWYLQRSRDGFTGVQFGFGTDLPAPADYDGDGKADVSVFRNGTWFLLRSTQGFTGVQFGASTDKPVPNALVP